jgi:2-C-methyl-D-erythritol 4-phosphate cytidylyltransferase
MPPEIWLMIPAAGSGSRMQAEIPKQYLPLGNSTLLDSTLNRVMQIENLSGCVLALAKDDTEFSKSKWSDHSKLRVIEGGASRAESVLAGLYCIRERAQGEAWVLVHDAARPCVSIKNIQALLQTCLTKNCGGILAARATDTIKRSMDAQSIDATEDRCRLWHAHTPQLFPLRELCESLERALAEGVSVTDEASAMEWAGKSVLLVRDSRENIKVTMPEDLAWAEFILENQRS